MTDFEAQYKPLAIQKAVQYGVDPGLFVAQIRQESRFNPRALSSAGAAGIAQLMPATAAGLGVDPWNPEQALDGAARLDASYIQRYHGDYALVLAAYNAGPGAVDRYGGVPPYAETQRYVAIILPALGSLTPGGSSSSGGSAASPAVLPSLALPSLPGWSNLSNEDKTLVGVAAAAGVFLILA